MNNSITPKIVAKIYSISSKDLRFRYDKALRYLRKFSEFFSLFHTNTIHKVYRENKAQYKESKVPLQGK